MTGQRHVRLFRNGRNQAVRIPAEFELPGNEAIMHRDGERLVVEPVRKRDRYMLDTNIIISDLIRNPQGKATAV